jgi:hypothetical protein
LAVDLDIAGTPAEDAATACTPRRRPSNISFVLNILIVVRYHRNKRQTTGRTVQNLTKTILTDFFLSTFLMQCDIDSLSAYNRGLACISLTSWESRNSRLQGFVNEIRRFRIFASR